MADLKKPNALISAEQCSWMQESSRRLLSNMPEQKPVLRIVNESKSDVKWLDPKSLTGERDVQQALWDLADYDARIAEYKKARQWLVGWLNEKGIYNNKLRTNVPKGKSMIKLDGKLLFEQWCKIWAVVPGEYLFMELPEKQILAWNGLADWLCRHEWESVDFAWQKVLKEGRIERLELAEAYARWRRESAQHPEERNQRAELAEWYKQRLAEQAEIDRDFGRHFSSCELRHGGKDCTC